LSNKNGKRLDLINKLLKRLEDKSKNGIPIIVEGRNDILSLNQLGIVGDFISAKTSGKSFLDLIGEIEQRESREVILLFDFDRTGKEWTRRLITHLEGMKITPNLVFWKMLLSLVGHDIKDIESLATFTENLKKKILMS
jgi:2,5-diamino-6-(ribosylamino)-4(3H)-pyrimidinone 5'-phosphate reductase